MAPGKEPGTPMSALHPHAVSSNAPHRSVTREHASRYLTLKGLAATRVGP